MLSKRIKERRLQLNMTQEELAQKVGYKTKGAISRIEKGERDISQTQISDFAKALNTSESYLMGWTDDVFDNSLPGQNLGLITLSQDEQDLLDNYNNSNNIGQKKILSYSKDITNLYPLKPTREQMIEYIADMQRAAYGGGSKNPHNMTDEELEEKYYQYKKDFDDE